MCSDSRLPQKIGLWFPGTSFLRTPNGGLYLHRHLTQGGSAREYDDVAGVTRDHPPFLARKQ